MATSAHPQKSKIGAADGEIGMRLSVVTSRRICDLTASEQQMEKQPLAAKSIFKSCIFSCYARQFLARETLHPTNSSACLAGRCPSNFVRRLRCIMPRIVFAVHVDAGGADGCMPEIVAHGFDIQASIGHVRSSGMPQPVGGCRLNLRRCGLPLVASGAQSISCCTHDAFDNLMDGAACERLFLADDGQHRGAAGIKPEIAHKPKSNKACRLYSYMPAMN